MKLESFVKSRDFRYFLFFAAIFAVAVFFRLWQLDSIPPGLYPDVAINGNDALNSLKSGDFKVFYPENNGREGLFFWLIAVSFLIFTPSVWAIRITSAIIGILTIPGIYLLCNELFGRDKKAKTIALFSSFLLAVSFWHVNFSRLGFRAIMLPFVLTFFFYFLLHGFRKQKAIDFILAGLFFGAGFYTYTSFRMAILFLFGYLGLKFWEYLKTQNAKPSFKKLMDDGWRRVLLFLFVIFIIALPLGIYFLYHPQNFISRAAKISIFTQSNPFLELGKSLVLHFGMFNIHGDPNWRHNYDSMPELFWPVGIAFIVGIIMSIRRIILAIRNRRFSLLTTHSSLLALFITMLLPGILTVEGLPHSLRTIGAIPPAFIFAGMGAELIYRKIKNIISYKKNFASKALLAVSATLLVLAFIMSQFNLYFFMWGKNPATANEFTKRFTDMGNYLNTLPDDVQKYVIVNENGVSVPFPDGLPMPAQTIMFLENAKFGKLRSVYLKKDEVDKINSQGQLTIIIPMAYDENIEKVLKEKFPQGVKKEVNGILIYQINNF